MTSRPFAETRRFGRALLYAAVVLGSTLACAASAGAVSPGAHQRAHLTTVKIVSDLPLHGEDRKQTLQMVDAIRFVLQGAHYRAGKYRIEFESHDDSLASTGEWDEGRCGRNARSYVADRAVVGVIGTYNAGCSAIEIPILNRAALAMVSPGNTYAGLTKAAIGNDFGEPATYYPAGGRNYARVVPSDDNEGRVAAGYMQRTLQATKVFVLNDRSDYGRLTAAAFEDEAAQLGLRVVGHDGWDRHNTSYVDLMKRIKAAGADALFIGGEEFHNGARLLKDKVAVLGGNGRVTVVVTDGFVFRSLIDGAGASTVEGIVGTSPAAPADRLGGAAGRFLDAFSRAEGDVPVYDWTIFAAAATQVLLDAIARSDGTRKDVVEKLFATDRAKTVLGPMSFDGNGDPRWAVEAIYRATNGKWIYVGSRSYESKVKAGKVAGASKKVVSLENAHPARDVYYAPYLPKADRFTGESILQTRLSDAAYRLSRFIGSPKTIDVACWSRWDWPKVADDDDIYSTFGFWMGDMPHWVHLSPETCRGIETLLHNRPAFPNAFTADAVQTLSHEMMHALGVDSEAEAECLGMQVSAVLAQDLGVPKHYALRLSHLNLENYADLPPEYIDRKRCRENGVWDLREDAPSPPWHAG
jgi:branched-chain amino acid transport system substrate-binding protein